MMKNRMVKTLGLGALTYTIATGTAEAQSSEDLLKSGVKNGVITEAEADFLRKKARQESSRTVAKWVERISFKGDLRLLKD